MAELRPLPLAALVTRMFGELEARKAIFGLPARKFFLGEKDLDTTVRFHGRTAGTPLGPAAGPHTQMAPNIVLAFLGGGRIMELKTVQVLDELTIARPCIDMETVGYNIEWSQELRLDVSFEEYVKASMLIQILTASGKLDFEPRSLPHIFDLSVGYDLKGIRSPAVLAFLAGMKDASAVVARLREQIPRSYGFARDLEFESQIASSVTLSTFHGCPPDEIEAMADFLLQEMGLSCVIKLNPTLLGSAEIHHLLGDQLGYKELTIPARVFAQDALWDQAVGFVRRLGETASRLGLGFGVKFSNTLMVENHRHFFPPGHPEMYLSGPPLHVLAMHLVRRFRRELGCDYPVSFSAGIGPQNFPDTVALGLVPVTACTDLLKNGGYARLNSSLKELGKRMRSSSATTLEEFSIRAHGQADAALANLDLEPSELEACRRALGSQSALKEAVAPEQLQRWVSAAVRLNTEHYVAVASADARYSWARNMKGPQKEGASLALVDCLSCDKCISACPNAANFVFTLAQAPIPVVRLARTEDDRGWQELRLGALQVGRAHQIGNFADACNECGNCDVLCPQDGGPYARKPRWFGSLAQWERWQSRDGFFARKTEQTLHLWGRMAGKESFAQVSDSGAVHYWGAGFDIKFEGPDGKAVRSVTGNATREVDLTELFLMIRLAEAVLAEGAANPVGALAQLAKDPPAQ